MSELPPMNFSNALEMLKQGYRLARQGWNNKGIWIEVQNPSANSKMTKPYLFMCKNGDKFPCDLSCESIFGDDWFALPEIDPDFAEQK